MIVKRNSRKVDSVYNHVAATTPQDRSSHDRLWRYCERIFPCMRTASFLGFFTFGRRSRGHRGPPHAQNFCSISMGKSMYPIILCGVSSETTRTSDVKSVCAHSGGWHTERYNTHRQKSKLSSRKS